MSISSEITLGSLTCLTSFTISSSKKKKDENLLFDQASFSAYLEPL